MYTCLSPQAGPLMGPETLLAGPSKKPFDPSGRPSDPSGKPSDPSGMPWDPSNRPLYPSRWLSDSFGQMDRRKDGWTDGCMYIQKGHFSIAAPSQLWFQCHLNSYCGAISIQIPAPSQFKFQRHLYSNSKTVFILITLSSLSLSSLLSQSSSSSLDPWVETQHPSWNYHGA